MKFFQKFNITFILITLTTITFAVIIVLVRQFSLDELNSELSLEFERIQSDIQKDQKISFNHLENTCYLLINDSRVDKYIKNETDSLVDTKIENIARIINSDIFIIFDKNKKIVFSRWTTKSDNSENKLSEYIGKLDTAKLWSGFKTIDNSLYKIAAQPLYKNNKYYGLLFLGLKITSKNVAQFKADSNIDVSIFHGYKFIESTAANSFEDSVRNEFIQFANEHRPIFDAVLSTQLNSGIFSTQFNFQDVLAFLFPARKGNSVFLMITIPKSAAFQLIEKVQKIIIIAAMICLIIIFLAVFLIERKIKRSSDVQKYDTKLLKKAIADGKSTTVITCFDISDLHDNIENSDDEFVTKNKNYLNLQNEILELYGGSLAQFLGDRYIAFFNGKNGIEQAIECAVTVQKIIKREFSTDKAVVRIGINCAQIDTGKSNTEVEKDNILVGNAFNLCVTLCVLAKPGDILIRKDLLNLIKMRYKTGETGILPSNEFTDEIQFTEILFDQRIKNKS